MKKTGIIILISAFIGLLSFSYFWASKGEERTNLPKYARRTAEVQAAYEYTLENPELLESIPCYCNCRRLGHQDVSQCFVREFKENGLVVFDEHGADCAICYSTVLDSKSLFEQRMSVREIRDYIDNKYSFYGQGTNTPLP